MGCFCHATLAPLTLALPRLNVSAGLLVGANVPLSLSAWLSARGLPALPWQPEPGWLGLNLPMPRLNASAIATISALASLRAQVLAQFGLDLLIAAQARAFARIVATLNARLSAMASLNAAGWIGLARLNAAIDQVNLALQAGLFAPPAHLLLALSVPGGIPMARWGGLLNLLRLLAPMIAACAQLNVSVTETAQLAAALRVLARLQLPALAAPGLMASLTAALAAVAQLRLGLGIAPLQLGLPAVRVMVQAKLGALLAALSAQFGSVNLLALLPGLPVIPTGFATSAVVSASMQAHALAALAWQVPPLLPAVQIGLPVCAFAARLQAALSVTAVLAAPCASGCDATAVLRAAG